MHRVAVDQERRRDALYRARAVAVPDPHGAGRCGWSFDVEGGREEMLDRRIGRNELDVIDLMRAYVRVQSRFRQTD